MQISSKYNVSLGHIYSNAVDKVLKNIDGKLTSKQEKRLSQAVDRASMLNKSVLTSKSQGLVLLTGENNTRNIYKIYPLGYDAKTNLDQLEDAVKDAEELEKTSLPSIDPLKGSTEIQQSKGFCENPQHSCYQYIFNKTYNGYTAKF